MTQSLTKTFGAGISEWEMNEKISILVIDDDTEDQQIIKEAFDLIESPTGGIHFVDDAQLALDFLSDIENPEDLPRLIVLDLNMPRISGVEMLQQLKAADFLKNIPVIILSSSSNPSDMEMTKKEGAADYVTKPSTFTQFKTIASKFATYCAPSNGEVVA